MNPVKITLFDGPKQRPNYQLTSKGRIKAEELTLSGNKGAVVGALETSESPCTVGEIANIARLSTTRVRQVIDMLVQDGWVMKVGSG